MKAKDIILRLLFSALFAVEVFLMVDAFMYLRWNTNWYYDFSRPHLYAAAVFCACFFGWFLFSFWAQKLTRYLPIILAGIGCIGLAVQICFSISVRYRDSGDSQASLFTAHRVMLIVPHEDDDLNVLGGIIEQYTTHDSEVYVVFVTNGDYYDVGRARIREATNCLALCGVDQEHVIFLGMAINGLRTAPIFTILRWICPRFLLWVTRQPMARRIIRRIMMATFIQKGITLQI